VPDRVQRIAATLNAAQREGKEVAAVVVPRGFARDLLDELYPRNIVKQATGVPAFDEIDLLSFNRREGERERYRQLIDDGGYVGHIFGRPMVVADDVVLCTLTEDEVHDCAGRLCFDVADVLGRE